MYVYMHACIHNMCLLQINYNVLKSLHFRQNLRSCFLRHTLLKISNSFSHSASFDKHFTSLCKRNNDGEIKEQCAVIESQMRQFFPPTLRYGTCGRGL